MESPSASYQVSERFKKLFANKGKELHFNRGERVYNAGDKPSGLYLVKDGLVGLTLLGTSGKEHLLRFFSSGQFFGHRSYASREPYHGSSVCLEKTSLWHLNCEQVAQAFLDEGPMIYEEMARTLALELGRVENQHIMILENQVLSRVAQSLVYLKELHGEHNWTREEIANFCASTGPTVIRALAQLEEKGLISQEGRKIIILDRSGLIELSD